MEVPIGFPEINQPEDNLFTYERWVLGKKLFFDPVMSLDNSISCSSCHNPSLAFSDSLSFSLGVDQRIGTRNASTLTNIGYNPYFTSEGGVPTLEMQVLVPIQEHNEFDFNIVDLAERLSDDPEYIEMSLEAYNRVPDPFVITRAIACYERSLLSGNSPYDKYVSLGNLDALTNSQLRGMDLFFSDKTNCFKCHDDFNFTNYEFENNGLYEVYEDEGRFRLTGLEEDRALFKIPTLRNIELTAPYMHDGSMQTLEEVITHYNTGGKLYFNKSELITPLELTENEIQDLVSFLKSLTDTSFVNNTLFSN